MRGWNVPKGSFAPFLSDQPWTFQKSDPAPVPTGSFAPRSNTSVISYYRVGDGPLQRLAMTDSMGYEYPTPWGDLPWELNPDSPYYNRGLQAYPIEDRGHRWNDYSNWGWLNTFRLPPKMFKDPIYKGGHWVSMPEPGVPLHADSGQRTEDWAIVLAVWKATEAGTLWVWNLVMLAPFDLRLQDRKLVENKKMTQAFEANLTVASCNGIYPVRDISEVRYWRLTTKLDTEKLSTVGIGEQPMPQITVSFYNSEQDFEFSLDVAPLDKFYDMAGRDTASTPDPWELWTFYGYVYGGGAPASAATIVTRHTIQ